MNNTNLGMVFRPSQQELQIGGARQLPEFTNGLVQLIGGNIEKNYSNAGGKIVFEVEVLDGEHAGKKGFHSINIFSQNPDAARIAGDELATIQAVTLGNLNDITDVSVYFNKPFRCDCVAREAVGQDGNKRVYKSLKTFRTHDGRNAEEALKGVAVQSSNIQQPAQQVFGATPPQQAIGAGQPVSQVQQPTQQQGFFTGAPTQSAQQQPVQQKAALPWMQNN